MKAFHILLTLLLYILFSVALFAIFSQPDDNSPTWLADFLRSKFLGALCALAAWAINRYLSRKYHKTIFSTAHAPKRREVSRSA